MRVWLGLCTALLMAACSGGGAGESTGRDDTLATDTKSGDTVFADCKTKGCDDGNACTKDLCLANGTCDYSADAQMVGKGCDDGDLCTNNDVCNATGSCLGEAIEVCDDKDPCTDDLACDPQKGCVFVPLPEGSECDNGSLCTEQEKCLGGQCTAVGKCADGSQCTTNEDCSDGVCAGLAKECTDGDPCTADTCDNSTGQCKSLPISDVACDDGDKCTEGDTCLNGECMPGTEVVCNDQNPCTVDYCDKKVGCKSDPVPLDPPTTCDDKNKCTDIDVCKTGVCKGVAKDCSDGNDCTDDQCDPASGCYQEPVSNEPCDDGNDCTVGDKCEEGECKPGKVEPCDDGIACTVGKCQAGGECVQMPDDAICDDGLACNGVEKCDPVEGKPETGCVNGIPIAIDDGIDCTVDSCDEDEDMPAHILDDAACDDGNACNGVETCSAKDGCIAGIPMDCDDKIACTTDDCSPGTGTCKHDPSDTLCDDANPCTEDGCVEGEGCKYVLLDGTKGGILCCPDEDDAVCNDMDSCTSDKCDIALHQCTYTVKADGALCSDELSCTKEDACKDGKCVGKAEGCDDGLTCTKDTCVEPNGCNHAPDDSSCDDTNVCTGSELCNPAADAKVNPSGCESVNLLTCVAPVACTVDGCDPKKGCTYAPDNGKCDDANICTADTCDAVKGCLKTYAPNPGCCKEEAAECDDGNSCTLDECDVAKFKCELSVLADGMACNDKNKCTQDDKCQAGQCSGDPVNCADALLCTVDTCDSVLGCVNTPSDIACNDSNVCTNDSCDKTAGCKYADNDGVDCSDGKADTVDDICSQGDCIGMPDPDLDGIANSGYLLPCTGGQTEACNDNCSEIPNPDQADADVNGVGDACDGTCDDGNQLDWDGCTDGKISEFLVATVAPCGYCGGSHPAVATLQDGGFAVVWSSETSGKFFGDIYGRVYGGDGQVLGNTFQAYANPNSWWFSPRPSIAPLAEGGFVVAWHGPDGCFDMGVLARRFDQDGAYVGSQFGVDGCDDNETLPYVASFAAGGFVLVWQDDGWAGSLGGIFGQRFTAAGAKVGSQFLANTYVGADKSSASVATFPDSGFVAVWSGSAEGDDGAVAGQRYKADGSKDGSEFLVNTTTAGSQGLPTVTNLAAGAFVVVWQCDVADGSGSGILAQRFSKGGGKLGSEVQVNECAASNQTRPVVASASSGTHVVAWESQDQDGSGTGIFGQRFGADGVKVGKEFQVNSYAKGAQADASVSVFADGSFVVVWASPHPDGSGKTGLFAQRFNADGTKKYK